MKNNYYMINVLYCIQAEPMVQDLQGYFAISATLAPPPYEFECVYVGVYVENSRPK